MPQHGLLLLQCVLLTTAIAKGADDTSCEPSKVSSSSASARHRLISDILCQYDPSFPPQKYMNISVQLFVRRAKVVERTLEIQALSNLRWTDQFLVWNPAQYDNLQEIQIHSDRIWLPAISTIATLPWIREESAQRTVWPAVCHVAYNGSVTCTSAMEMGGVCVVAFLYWPHVEAACAVYVGSDFRNYKNLHVVYDNDTKEDELKNYVPDNDWVVTESIRHNLFVGEVGVTYAFKLHSRGAVLLTGLLGPGVVLSLLLLGSFCLPPNSYVRLGLCCCGIFGTILSSSLFFETLPPYDGPNPIIVSLYSGLLILAALATFMSLLLSSIVPRARKPPAAPRWLYSFQSWITCSAAGKIWLKLLLINPKQHVCQAIELMPALHMQTGDTPPPINKGREENEDNPSRADVTSNLQGSSGNIGSGPHRIWDFMSSFANRCMFSAFLIACSALCLNLVHSMRMYHDVDIDEYFD